MTHRDPPHTESTAELARTLFREAELLFGRAEYPAARSLYERALDIQETLLGPAHPDTARTLSALAQVQAKQGEDAAARRLLERALAIQETALGPAHPDAAATLQALGELIFNLGEFQAGFDLVARAAAIRAQALGAEHASTLDSRTLLALLSLSLGDKAGAEQALSALLSICERALGEDHRTTARVVNALGRLNSMNPATYARARALYERSLAIYQRVLGPDHPETALVLSNLAAVLSDLDDDQSALPLLERSLAIHERVYGPDNWRTSFVLLNLADLYRRDDRHGEARRLIERALVIREHTWGGRHPETLRAVRKLVIALESESRQGDETAMLAAIPYYQCLTALEATTGKMDAPEVPRSAAVAGADRAADRLHELVARLEADLARPPHAKNEEAELGAAARLAEQAAELYEQGDYGAAAEALEEALSRQERVLGRQHLDHVPLLKQLAEAKKRLGHYSAVLPITRRIAEIYVEVLGRDHPSTSAALMHLMSVEDYEYGPAAALPIQERILQSLEERAGRPDDLIALARATLDRLMTETRERAAGTRLPDASVSERREEALSSFAPDEEGPLAGMDDIDWHGLRHAYGPADDVPNLLRLLLSDDSDVRDSAWQELYGNIWHQGDIYEATPYAVPFLIAMLDAEEPPDPAGVLFFLHALATGAPWLTKEHTWMEEALAAEGRDYRVEIEDAQLSVTLTRQAVSMGARTYVAYLDHPLPLVRHIAGRLLLTFPEHAHHVPPALAAEIEAEQDAEDADDDWRPELP